MAGLCRTLAARVHPSIAHHGEVLLTHEPCGNAQAQARGFRDDTKAATEEEVGQHEADADYSERHHQRAAVGCGIAAEAAFAFAAAGGAVVFVSVFFFVKILAAVLAASCALLNEFAAVGA